MSIVECINNVATVWPKRISEERTIAKFVLAWKRLNISPEWYWIVIEQDFPAEGLPCNRVSICVVAVFITR